MDGETPTRPGAPSADASATAPTATRPEAGNGGTPPTAPTAAPAVVATDPGTIPTTAFLPDITPEDYHPIEDVFDARTLEAADVVRDETPPRPYDRVPEFFTCLEEWPLATNIKCAACDFFFDTRPCPVVTFIRRAGTEGRLPPSSLADMGGVPGPVELGEKILAGVERVCNTWNCAALYVHTKYPRKAYPIRHDELMENLRIMYFLFTGIRTKNIKPGPDRFERQIYGGDLTDEQYLAKLYELDPVRSGRTQHLGSNIPDRHKALAVKTPRITGVPVWDTVVAAAPASATASSPAFAIASTPDESTPDKSTPDESTPDKSTPDESPDIDAQVAAMLADLG